MWRRLLKRRLQREKLGFLALGPVPLPQLEAGEPSRDRPYLPNERYIGTESPSGSAFAAHAVPGFAPGKLSGPNQRQMYQRQAAGCRQRGNALRPCAPKKQNNGPYSASFQARTRWVNGTEGPPLRKLVENGENSVVRFLDNFESCSWNHSRVPMA